MAEREQEEDANGGQSSLAEQSANRYSFFFRKIANRTPFSRPPGKATFVHLQVVHWHHGTKIVQHQVTYFDHVNKLSNGDVTTRLCLCAPP